MTKPRVFISYSSIDDEVANAFASLFDELYIDYFLDKKEISWGDPVEPQIGKGIKDCSHLIVIISPASAQSLWVPYEVGQARALNKTLLPFLTHPKMSLPSYLASIHYTSDFQEVRNYFDKLAVYPRNESEDDLTGVNKKNDRKSDTPAQLLNEQVLISKSEFYSNLPEVNIEEIILNAVSRIDFICVRPTVLVDKILPNVIESLRKTKDLRFRMLSLDPDSNFVGERANDLGIQRRNFREEVRSSLIQIASMLESFKYEDRFQIRFYENFPTLTLYIIDDNVVIVPELFGKQSPDTCHILASVKTPGVFDFLFHFNYLWSNAMVATF